MTRNRRIIGRFTLYESGAWEIKANEVYSYFISFDPEYNDFADFLSWDIPASITGYLTNSRKKAVVPLTVEFPYWGSSAGYGAISLEMTVSSGGAVISWEDDHVEELYSIGYQPMPITVHPGSGVLEPAR